MASARGANSVVDGYTRFNDDVDNIEGSYQSNNISKLTEYFLFIKIILFVFRYKSSIFDIFDICYSLPVTKLLCCRT